MEVKWSERCDPESWGFDKDVHSCTIEEGIRILKKDEGVMFVVMNNAEKMRIIKEYDLDEGVARRIMPPHE
jgi:hypothetical protein